jgi:hypothetical protein
MTIPPRLQPRFVALGVSLLVLCLSSVSVEAYAQVPSTVAHLSSGNTPDSAKVAGDALRSGFINPPPSARLRCYWWWLNGHVPIESIDHDLTEMKAKGYGGVLLVDANGADAENNDPVPVGPVFGSPARTVLFLHAVKAAHKLGPDIILTITDGPVLGICISQESISSCGSVHCSRWCVRQSILSRRNCSAS